MVSKVVIYSGVLFIFAIAAAFGTVIYFNAFQNSEIVLQQSACSHNSSKTNGQTGVDFGDKKSSDISESRHQLVPSQTSSAFKPLEDLSVTKVNGQHVKPGILIYDEEFRAFNTTVWNHYTEDSDSEFYFYVADKNNSYVQDGKLFIKPTADKFGEPYLYNGTLLLGTTPSEKNSAFIVHPIVTAMITTKETLHFRYGILVIRAKMPAGDWIDPIIVLRPVASIYGNGFVSGQVYLTDTRGNRKLFNNKELNVGSERTCPDIRFGTHDRLAFLSYCLSTHQDKGFDTEFHDYELLWTPESIRIKIDGESLVSAPPSRPSIYKYWSQGREIKNPWRKASNPVVAPFDTEFYLMIGLNVGGNGFADDSIGPYPKPWKNNDPNASKYFWEKRENWEPSWQNENSALQIESIKLWSLNTTTSDRPDLDQPADLALDRNEDSEEEIESWELI